MTVGQSDHGRINPAMTADLNINDDRSNDGGGRWVIIFGMVFLFAAIGFALYARFGSEERLTVGPMEQDTGEEVQPLVATTAPAESSTTTVAAGETSVTQLVTTSSVATATVVTGPPLEGVLQSGAVELSGTVPSAASGDSFVALFESFVGDGNVTQSFTISPDAPVPTSFRLNVTDTVLFVAGGETISTEFFPLLDQIVGFMEADPNVTLVVKGHTDADGSSVDNLALSQRRAEAVRSYLEERGINAFRLDARGRGDTEPVAENETEEGRRLNRRIELLLIGIQTPEG